MDLKVKRLHDDAEIPCYITPGSVGMDLHAYIPANTENNPKASRSYFLRPGERRLIMCGVAIELPFGCEGQIRPRSGLALKHGVSVLNAPGSIDTDYRGELGVILYNSNLDYSHTITHGDRIAQLIIAPITHVTPREVEELSGTRRGAGGFGHTGS